MDGNLEYPTCNGYSEDHISDYEINLGEVFLGGRRPVSVRMYDKGYANGCGTVEGTGEGDGFADGAPYGNATGRG